VQFTLKIRSAAGLAIEELLAVFAASLIRWAIQWLQHSDSMLAPLARAQASVKRSVRIGANTCARILLQPQGCLLRFKEDSPFAGMELPVGNKATQPSLPPYTCSVSGPT
jgi:hypothetical protein